MKQSIFKGTIVGLAVTLLPSVVLAATSAISILGVVKRILDLLIPIVITLAVVIFFFGLAMYLVKADEDKEKGRTIMIYGIITLFVMVAVWGLVGVIAETFDINRGGTAPIPEVRLPGSSDADRWPSN